MIVVTWLLERDDKHALLLGSADQPDHSYVWWAYSLGIYREVFRMLGFDLAAVTKNKYRFNRSQDAAERYTMIATRAQ
jgi:hypothetical protein